MRMTNGAGAEWHSDIISRVQRRNKAETAVYNLEVEDDHTYFANGILVHNCGACLALDGERYEVEEPIDSHPGCRCAMVPVTIGYRDLGLDVDTPEGDTTTSRDWFEEQSEATQRSMMGNAKFEAWQAGQFDLKDMAKITHDPVWGDAAMEKPLKELIGA